MIRNNIVLLFLFSCHALYTSNNWRMPTTFDDYDPQQSTAPRSPIEAESHTTIYTPSLQHVMKYLTENYCGQKHRPQADSPTVSTPIRMQLSVEFNTLQESMAGSSYSPAEHAEVSNRAQTPLTASVIHDIDVIANTLFEKWAHAEKRIKQGDLLFKNQRLSLEECHHYRLKSLILGLNVFYKYRKIMVDNNTSAIESHYRTMLEIMLAARISFALSFPINPEYCHNRYRYKRADDFMHIQEIYKKINTKLCPKNTHQAESIVLNINDNTTCCTLELPTQAMAIPPS